MAKYRLLAEHVTPDGVILAAGTEVGDDTSIPWPWEPSNLMEPLDGDAEKKVNELHQKLYGHDFVHPGAMRPEQQKAREEEAKKAAEQEEEVVGGEPVSEQQRVEYEAMKKGEPVRAPAPASPTIRAATTRGGATTPAPGPATPRVDPDAIRPTRPNEEQSPKG